MGCDIHIGLERRVDGKWERVPVVDPWHAQYRKRFWKPGELVLPQNFADRNYDLFGILANVRNGTWGHELTPIAEPRGWPDDSPTDPHADTGADGPWYGDHSFSCVTLAELQAYPWDATILKRGWVSAEVAAKFREDGIPPESYAAGGSHGEYIEWDETIRKSVRDWPTEILPILGALGNPEDVRLCFGFDS